LKPEEIVEDRVLQLLKTAKTIAVVGLSDNKTKPSYGVSAYLQSKGYRVVPIHPKASEVLGEKAYPSLSEAAKIEKIDIVDVFRRPDAVPAIVDEVLALKLPALWLQETVVHEEAAEKARQAGVVVVMDKCILKEHRRYGL
jgi:predicted CoA-binding protein